MNALGCGQRERFRRCEVLRHRNTGGPRDEVPNYYACENHISRAVSEVEGEKEIPLERRNKHRQICLPRRARTGEIVRSS